MNATRTVLCVEDDRNEAFLLSVAFEELGHLQDLRFACDGQDAIDYLSGAKKYADRQAFPLPNVILVDVKLPRIGGHELLHWIRNHPEHRNRVVIFFSASGDEQDLYKAYSLGANSYVSKPPTLDKTTQFVRMLYGYWFELNEFSLGTAAPAFSPSTYSPSLTSRQP